MSDKFLFKEKRLLSQCPKLYKLPPVCSSHWSQGMVMGLNKRRDRGRRRSQRGSHGCRPAPQGDGGLGWNAKFFGLGSVAFQTAIGSHPNYDVRNASYISTWSWYLVLHVQHYHGQTLVSQCPNIISFVLSGFYVQTFPLFICEKSCSPS